MVDGRDCRDGSDKAKRHIFEHLFICCKKVFCQGELDIHIMASLMLPLV